MSLRLAGGAINQWFSKHSPLPLVDKPGAPRGEMRLAAAIFELALHDLACPTNTPTYRLAADWFWSDASDWPFSVVCICDLFGWDLGAVREQLHRQVRA
jgi:hypothetical protein